MIIYHFTDLNENIKSGISEVVENLTYYFNKKGYKSLIVTINKDEVKNYRRINSLQSFEDLLGHGKNNRIVIFHSVYKFSYLKYYWYCYRNKIDYFIYPHGGLTIENFQKNKFLKWLSLHCIFKLVLNKAKGVIYLSKKEFKKNVLNLKSDHLFIPNGINPFFKNKLNSKYYLYDGVRKINFLFFGRIDIHHKGIDKLIEGIDLLPKRTKDNIIINFYGYGNSKDEKYLMEKMKSNSNIKFHGSVFDPTEKNNVFLSSDIFILTSRYEGMPISVLEALSSGLPCLVSTETNVEDIIHNYKCGWVIDENTPKNISKTIQLAVEDYKLNKELLIENSILCANNNYTWSKVVDKASQFIISNQ